MVSRRNFLKAGTLAALPVSTGVSGCTSKGRLQGQQDAFREDFGFITPADDPIFGDSSGDVIKTAVGTGNSRHAEVRRAFRLLWDSPRTVDHMAIAQYFENIQVTNQNEHNYSGAIAKYNEEWQASANPLITSFFAMTNTVPSSGDQTPWCAAFVSFVLYASNKPNMFSALSGSYRSYMTATTTPKFGDVVVFRKYGNLGDRGFGHVGFYISEDETTVTVLGGNQRGTTGSTGAVVRTRYAKIGKSQELHSFRAVPTN